MLICNGLSSVHNNETEAHHMAFFSGFTHHRIRTTGATINAVSAGTGEPVLLLHGYPQTMAC